ncbi:unnamed protein product [Plutella xylostella]|uniref:(diamondback moth) hypothetical protein n=1 Tax=Plutella xylostella TaxID=51655 RepID=A0A8S4FCW3_PLUXY|nr:unnamed protein product [Plutella xylostella]
MFSQLSDSNGHLKRVSVYLRAVLALPAAVYESPSFSYSDALPRAMFNQNTKITVNDFLDTLMSEPGPPSLVWLPLLHRLASVENVVHPCACTACRRQPLCGFRYRCTRCANYTLCQDCFWRGRVSHTHTIEHELKEYSTYCIASSGTNYTLCQDCFWRGRVSYTHTIEHELKEYSTYCIASSGTNYTLCQDCFWRGRVSHTHTIEHELKEYSTYCIASSGTNYTLCQDCFWRGRVSHTHTIEHELKEYSTYCIASSGTNYTLCQDCFWRGRVSHTHTIEHELKEYSTYCIASSGTNYTLCQDCFWRGRVSHTHTIEHELKEYSTYCIASSGTNYTLCQDCFWRGRVSHTHTIEHELKEYSTYCIASSGTNYTLCQDCFWRGRVSHTHTIEHELKEYSTYCIASSGTNYTLCQDCFWRGRVSHTHTIEHELKEYSTYCIASSGTNYTLCQDCFWRGRVSHTHTIEHELKEYSTYCIASSGTNYTLCQDCFWRGRVSHTHTIEHELKEYSTYKSPSKQLGATLRASFRCVPERARAALPRYPEQPERTLDLSHIRGPSVDVARYIYASVRRGRASFRCVPERARAALPRYPEQPERTLDLSHIVSNFDKEAARSIQLGWAAFGKLHHIFSSAIPQSLKIKVFNQCVLPVMTYGAQTWKLKVGLVQRFKVAERAMLGVSLMDRMRNEVIHQGPPSPVPAHNGFPEYAPGYVNTGSLDSRSSRSTHRSIVDHLSRGVDDEHRLIARYAARLAQENRTMGRSSSEGSEVDCARQQRELITQLEAKNREIMREIARLRSGRSEVVITQLEAKNREIMREIARLRRQQEAEASSGQPASAPPLVSELRLLRQRKGELETQLCALQESRKHLMHQLESLMTMLKTQQSSPRSTPNSSPRSTKSPPLPGAPQQPSAPPEREANQRGMVRSAPQTPSLGERERMENAMTHSLVGIDNRGMRTDLMFAADSVTNAMSTLVRELNSEGSDTEDTVKGAAGARKHRDFEEDDDSDEPMPRPQPPRHYIHDNNVQSMAPRVKMQS